MRKTLKWLLFAILGLCLATLGAYGYLRQSLPQVSGSLQLQGLGAPVEVLRDRFGIPHIYARSIADAHFALGFVHAQDRLWQMEMSRRIAAGRLAEVVGRGALETDRFLRTLGVRRAAEANLRIYDAETRRLLEAYAAGVNAFLATRPVLPPEFWITGVTPEPWSPADSVAWTKMMAWDLGANWRNELLRMRLSRTIAMARIHELLPPYPGDVAPETVDLKALYGTLEKPAARLAQSAAGDEAGGQAVEGLGSNSWAVAGARSASGKPLLANDPHLGLTAPPVWYFAQLNAPGLDAIGATLPGVPGILVGRNARIAWGFTNTGPDVQDLYLEKIDAAGNYLTPAGPRAFTTLTETIKVKGAPDEPLTVRISRHGPIISDVSRSALELAPRGHAMALAWTALAEDDLTMQAAVRAAQAHDWPSFISVVRHFHAPQQNVMYADVDGNIGFVSAGRVPVRRPDNDLKGLAPAPGWEARYDWAGYVPFEELPRAFNPPGGTLVIANQKVTPPGYKHHITHEWELPYRARRIEQLLEAAPKHSIATFARMHGDVVSTAARDLLAQLLHAQPRSPAAADALRRLSAWDGTMAAERVEPLILVAWWRELARGIYSDELGDAFRSYWRLRPVFLLNVLADRAGQSRWCDDVRTPQTEDCARVLADSLENALADLRRRYGEDVAKWRWGEPHAAHLQHRPFSRVAVLARLFDIRIPTPGDAFTVNVGRPDFSDEAAPFASRHAASLRAIYDLGDPQASLFIHPGGPSGNVLSRHYRSFTEAWARGEYVPMTSERTRLEAAGVQRLELIPRK